MKIILVCLLIAVSLVRVDASEIVAVVESATPFGKDVQAKILAKDLKTAPGWNVNTDAIPLRVDEAVKNAANYASKFKPDGTVLEVADIHIRRAGEARYYYVVDIQFPPASGKMDGMLLTFKVVVLMNGYVVPLTEKIPNKQKW